MKYSKLGGWLILQLCTVSMLHALSEDSIKIAYIERFAMFIQWPHPIEEYTICINDDVNFANTLKNSYKSRLFNGKKLQVVSLAAGASSTELSMCNLLYYRGSKPNQNISQLNNLQKNHVLIISDDPDDPHKGGMISFFIQNNAYRFVINHRNLINAELSASYKLLNFATVIDAVDK